MYRNRRNIDYETYLNFARLVEDDVELTCPKVFDDEVQAVFENKKTNPDLNICGTTDGFTVANNFAIDEGRNLSNEDVEFSRSVCVIGRQIVSRLFPHDGSIGQVIKLDGKNYEVIGTFAPKGGAFGTSDDDFVIIPITKFFENYGSRNRSINVAIAAKDQTALDRTMGFAVEAFRKARSLRPEQPNDFEIYSNDSLAGAFRSIAGVVRIGAFVISTIALVAAGIGIMNIMLVNVTERTKEIGVRKSLGARSRDIHWQFLLEALFLSLEGAVSGIILGVLAGNALAVCLKASVVFPWGWGIFGVLFCSAIGILSGLYPAHKAASLDPIDALRFE